MLIAGVQRIEFELASSSIARSAGHGWVAHQALGNRGTRCAYEFDLRDRMVFARIEHAIKFQTVKHAVRVPRKGTLIGDNLPVFFRRFFPGDFLRVFPITTAVAWILRA
jgi:hypothetical protein